MSCNYYHGKCIFLNGKVYEEGCIACPIKSAYSKGVIDTKKDYERPHEELLHTDDFNLPYRLTGDVASKDYIVVAVGTFAVENIIVFVRRAEQ